VRWVAGCPLGVKSGNAHSGDIENGESYKKPLKLHGLPPEQIVIEAASLSASHAGVAALAYPSV
jgi:hypothetical protein